MGSGRIMVKVGAVIAAMVAATGCQPPDVSGSWKGTWRLDWGLGDGDISLTLKQTDTDISGSYDVDDTLCAQTGDVEGTIDNHSVTLTLHGELGGRVDISGTLGAGDQTIDGDFEVTQGWCGAGAEGTVDLDRQ